MTMPASHRAGFTLVECLAVVVLTALALGVVAGGVAPSTQEARLQDTRSAILDADARARALARHGESVLLKIEDGCVVALVGAQRSPVLRRKIPAAITAAFVDLTSGEPLAAVRIGSHGISRDYLVSVWNAGSTSTTLVAGLTGYAFDEQREHRP